ncbi:hypothetical protein HPULCUR_011243 [Helicostylum pulchrum]|uniref:Uncharacterized protein n=1 Tax=Helicostylum pulchrum TaxID=562976 RepID=A0ABP9YFI2_9FUNG
MTLDEHYICQRAANAIISEIGPFRVSTDALQAINQFLDEFIVLLLTCSLSLDLSDIKSVVFSLLPSTLGKNAIVEAELEVKTFTETESIDYDLYERMRSLGGESKFPLDEAIPLLREKCFEYCTLADKDDQMYLQKSIRNKRIENDIKIAISPIVAIYVTTVMEHIAEYLLTAVAMTAEHEDTDYVRVKEVFLALVDDIQLGDVFNRMDLRDKMEKRAGLFNLNANKARNSYLPATPTLPPPTPTSNRKSYSLDQHDTGSFLDITFDDMDFDFDDSRKSTVSRMPEIRPQSAMSQASNYTLNNNSNRKSTFHLFKNNRNSFSGDVPPRASSPVGSVYDPDAPSMNFDDLIKSGGTVKVSLTPNRLRSIEIKDQTKDELHPPPLTWERRSTSSPRLSASIPSRPSSPLVRQNTSSSVKTNHSKKSTHTTKSNNQGIDPIEVPKLNARPSTPSSPLSKKSFSVQEKARFENPREAPPTPLSPLLPVAAPTPVLSTPTIKSLPVTHSPATSISSSQYATRKVPTPLPKLNATPIILTSNISVKSAIPSSESSDSISSEISSVTSIPSPVAVIPPPSADNLSMHTPNSVQEPPVPKPTKSVPLISGMVIRRSSVSSRKSRENLKRAKEDSIMMDDPMPSTDPMPSMDPIPTMVLPKKEHIITDEPISMERQVHFDQATELTESPNVSPIPSPSPSPPPPSQPVLPAPSEVGVAIPRKKAATLSPERPSSMVAKRASMVGNNRRRSLHESYATEKYHQDILQRQRGPNVGSVSVSIKQWDDILKPEEQASVIPPAAHRRSVLRQLRQQQLKEQLQLQQDLLQQQQKVGEKKSNESLKEESKGGGMYLNPNNSSSNAVLDKVLKFERASSLDDDVAHQRVSHMPRRERFLYLQQDPSAIERKSTIAPPKQPVVRRVGIDQGVQTDPTSVTKESVEEKEEQGMVDGDEEWFLQDDEWDEQEEAAMVEWLLGE